MKKYFVFAWWMVIAAVAVLPAAALAEGPAAADKYTFEGTITSEQWGAYFRLPFQVPEGTTAITVSYTYNCDDGTQAYLEIGIHDPAGFRGWSSASKSEFVVSESRELTSDSYIAGDIPAGEWQIELGMPLYETGSRIMQLVMGSRAPQRSTTISYRVEVALSNEPAGTPFTVPAKQDVRLNTTPGWYTGDLHCHSTHSDGALPLAETLDFAHSQGLDFIATTEHNTISHFSYLGEMQQRYDDMLILYGIEFTSYIGHANVYNYPAMVDFRATEPGYDVNAELDKIHAGGGYFSPNHPASFLTIGIPFKIENVDFSKVDFYEIVNGTTRIFGLVPNPINRKALRNWDRMLRAGLRITAIGGSDDHEAGQADNPISTPIGTPATMVYAEELSTQAILHGLDAGHVYVKNAGPSELAIEFTAVGNGQKVIMGDLITADAIEYLVTIKNARFKTLVIIENGLPLCLPIMSDDFHHDFKRKPRSPGYIRLEVRSGPYHEIITNPIYYAPAAN